MSLSNCVKQSLDMAKAVLLLGVDDDRVGHLLLRKHLIVCSKVAFAKPPLFVFSTRSFYQSRKVGTSSVEDVDQGWRKVFVLDD